MSARGPARSARSRISSLLYAPGFALFVWGAVRAAAEKPLGGLLVGGGVALVALSVALKPLAPRTDGAPTAVGRHDEPSRR